MIGIDRPKFRELHLSEIDIGTLEAEGYDMVQLKMDGIWGTMAISNGEYTIHSRTGKLKAKNSLREFEVSCAYDSEETILLGEYMKGSHWGHKMDIDGNFYAFDCIKRAGVDLRSQPYKMRLAVMNAILDTETFGFVYPLISHPISMWKEIWDSDIMKYGYEGLVFKKSKSSYHDTKAWARLKAKVEIDYWCVAMGDADPESKYVGKVGSVIGTLVDKVCAVKCGGLSEEMRSAFTEHPERYIGQVFTAKGNGWYPSGAIRHPKFLRWRGDKEMDDCTYAQVPEIIRES
jgi:ATP-dependent DNA ligase